MGAFKKQMKSNQFLGFFYSRLIILIMIVSLFNVISATYLLLFFLFVLISKKSGPILFLYLFFSIILYQFILEDFSIKTTFYDLYYESKYYLQIRFHFLWFVLIFLFFNKGEIVYNSKMNLKEEDIFYFVTISFLFFILLFGKTGETVLTSSYGKNSVNSFLNLSINEYYFLLLNFLFYTYRVGNLVHLISFLYLVKNILYGGRIEALQLLISYIIYFNINIKKPVYFILLFSISIIFEFIGIARSTGLSFDQFIDFSRNLSLFDFETFNKSFSTFGEVIYSSSVITGTIQESLISNDELFIMKFQHILSCIIPYSLLSNSANISSYIQTFSPSGGGALISTYFYFLFGFFGVVFFSSLYSYIFKKVNLSKSRHINSITFLLIATSPRWLLYNHVTFIKSFLFYSILLLSYKVYSTNFKQKKFLISI